MLKFSLFKLLSRSTDKFGEIITFIQGEGSNLLALTL